MLVFHIPTFIEEPSMSFISRLGKFGTTTLGLAGALALSSNAFAENWPQWRGPTLDGICKESKLPTSWSADKNIAWSLPMPGMGGSTPVIWKDKIFLTSVDGENQVVLCINTAGKKLWEKKLGEGNAKVRTDEGNGASASCSTDGKYVWAFVGSGTLACMDLDGKEIWSKDLQKEYGKFKIQFGIHSTPVLHENSLYMMLIHDGGGFVISFDKNTGKENWKIERPSDGTDENKHSYASPVLWNNGKDAALIIHGNDYATGHSLKDGKELWRVAGLNPKGDKYNKYLRFVASPVAVADLIVVPSAKNGPVVAIKPDARGLIQAGNSHEVWRKPSNTPDVPSPLVHDGLVYLSRENGFLICIDAKTGQEYYNERVYSSRYRGSPVYADGKIYITARDGTISVIKAGKKYELLATNKLPVQLSASLAIADGKIYVRGFETLYCIQEK